VICTDSMYAVGMGIDSVHSPYMVLARACGFSSTAQVVTVFAAAPFVFFRTTEVKGYIF
jgi:hypothetical protein